MVEPSRSVVLLPHLAGHQHGHGRLEHVRDLDPCPQRAALRDQLTRQDAAGGRIDGEPAVRRHRQVAGAANQGAAALLLVLQLECPARSPSLEREPRAVLRFEHGQGEHRDVDVPVDPADVVAGARGRDVVHLLLCGRRRLEEQLCQPFRAIAHRLAVDFKHVAELDPAVAGRRAHQQHVRLQIPPLSPRFRREAARIGAGDASDLLTIGLFRDHADEGPLVGGDVVAGLVEHGVELIGSLGGERQGRRAEGQ